MLILPDQSQDVVDGGPVNEPRTPLFSCSPKSLGVTCTFGGLGKWLAMLIWLLLTGGRVRNRVRGFVGNFFVRV